MKEIFHQSTEQGVEKVNFSIFHEYFPDAEIKEAGIKDIPKKALEYFEFKSSQFLLPDEYKPENFEKFFTVRHTDDITTFIAQQTKTYYHGDIEKLTFFADYNGEDIIGRAELRLNIKCAQEDEEYFRNKPFVGWIETNEDSRKSGLGTKRLFLMNAISQMCYSQPVYSDTLNSPQMKNVWEKLVELGSATKFRERNHDRYVFLDKKL